MTGVALTETYIAIITISLLLGMVLVSSSSAWDGVVSWAIAFFLRAVTYLVLLFCPAEQAPLGLFLATLFYSTGSAFMLRGLSQFVGQPLKSWVLWLPPLLVLATPPFLDIWPTARMLGRGAILTGQLAFLLWFLLRHRQAMPGRAKYWLGLGVAVVLGVQLSRIGYAASNGVDGWVLLSLVDPLALEQFGFQRAASLALVIMLPLLIGTSSLAIVKERYSRKSQDAQAIIQKVFDSIPHQFCVIDKTGEITAVNRAWTDFAIENGGDPSRVGIRSNYLDVTRASAPDIEEGIRGVLEQRLDHFRVQYPCHQIDKRRWFLMQVAPLDTLQGKAVISHTDITGQVELELLRERNLGLFRDIARSVPGILYKVRQLSDGKGTPVLDFMSPRISELGLDPKTVLEDANRLLSLVHPDDLPEMMVSVRRSATARSVWMAEFRVRQRDGSYRWYEGRAVPEPDESESEIAWYGYFHDIQERKNAAEKSRIAAQRDSLTGLFNRHLFYESLNQGLATARRERHKLAVLFIDLNRFKPVNDRYGHEMGDFLLRGVADRLRRCLREMDTPARLGGDEFAVLLHKVGTEEDVRRVVTKLDRILAEPYRIRDLILPVSASIGYSVFPDDGVDASSLIAHADLAMYEVKHQCHRAEKTA